MEQSSLGLSVLHKKLLRETTCFQSLKIAVLLTLQDIFFVRDYCLVDLGVHTQASQVSRGHLWQVQKAISQCVVSLLPHPVFFFSLSPILAPSPKCFNFKHILFLATIKEIVVASGTAHNKVKVLEHATQGEISGWVQILCRFCANSSVFVWNQQITAKFCTIAVEGKHSGTAYLIIQPSCGSLYTRQLFYRHSLMSKMEPKVLVLKTKCCLLLYLLTSFNAGTGFRT